MELKVELVKVNSNGIRMMKVVSLEAVLLHHLVKRIGQKTEKAHTAELQKNIK